MSLNNMKNRIKYYGGASQIDRMNADKLKSLKKAMLYSYQAAIAILKGGREFRCLINPDKLSLDVDNKILSIPFKDYCLNGGTTGEMSDSTNTSHEGTWEDMLDLTAILTYTAGDEWEDMAHGDDIEDLPDPEPDIIIPSGVEIETGIKEGDVITWKQNGSHWLVYLRRLEETAYFRADLRRCRYQLTLGNGSEYWVYVRGPVEQNLTWSRTGGNYINTLSNTAIMYITQNDETTKYFSRFKKVMVNNQPWEVQVVDSISTPGILQVRLKETYNNTIENNINKAVEEAEKKEEPKEQNGIYIKGLDKVYPYDIVTYELKNYRSGGGRWLIMNESRPKLVKLINETNESVEVQIITGKSGSFTLAFVEDDFEVAAIDITIGSL